MMRSSISKFFHHSLIFLSVVLLSSSLLVLLPVYASAQGKDRKIKIKTFPDQPVEIVAVKVKGTVIERDKTVTGDSDWLNGLTATIKNVSDKPVIYVTVSVTAFYEKDGLRKRTTDGRDRGAAVDFGYGLRPRLPGEPPRSYSAQPLMPDQTADLVFSTIHRDQLFGLLRQENASTDIPELTIWIDHVAWYNEDDKMWIRGIMYRLDPTNPRRWLPIEDPDAPISRLNHVARKPNFELARFAGLNLAPRFMRPVDPPPCVYKDGGEEIKHCTAVDTRGIPCDYEDEHLYVRGTKNAIAGIETTRYCHGIDPQWRPAPQRKRIRIL